MSLALLSLGLTLADRLGNERNSDASRQADRENALRSKEEGEELYRRTILSFTQQRATATSKIAASGISGTSRTNYQAQLAQEQNKQLNWIQKTIASHEKKSKTLHYETTGIGF